MSFVRLSMIWMNSMPCLLVLGPSGAAHVSPATGGGWRSWRGFTGPRAGTRTRGAAGHNRARPLGREEPLETRSGHTVQLAGMAG
jgi:hypothetical protein